MEKKPPKKMTGETKKTSLEIEKDLEKSPEIKRRKKSTKKVDLAPKDVLEADLVLIQEGIGIETGAEIEKEKGTGTGTKKETGTGTKKETERDKERENVVEAQANVDPKVVRKGVQKGEGCTISLFF